MKIKRYTAVSMRAALAQVRAEQGADAVILSSRRGEEGIEVIAAVDYDEALFAAANRQRGVAPAIAAQAAEPTPSRQSVRASAPAVDASSRESVGTRIPDIERAPPTVSVTARVREATGGRDTVAGVAAAGAHVAATTPGRAQTVASTPGVCSARTSASVVTSLRPTAGVPASSPQPGSLVRGGGYSAMRRELQDMRQLLETGLAGMTWNDRRLREPLKARVLEELTAMDIAPDVAMALAALTPRRTSLQDPSHIPLALLVRYLPVVDDLSTVTGGIMAVVGPTGAGKTTTIAKLAARWCMQHSSQDLALVSTDGYRIGAREQLMTYGRILGVPVHAANNGVDLGRVLERLKSKKLILIDTAGMGARDVRLTEQLTALKLGAARARVLLALPAQGEGHALEEICRAYARAVPAACILTKVDEAASLGAVISTILRHKLKIAYVCDGQQVPDDLHAAHQKRIWLLRAAMNLKERRPPLRDEAYFARNFGQAPAHA